MLESQKCQTLLLVIKKRRGGCELEESGLTSCQRHDYCCDWLIMARADCKFTLELPESVQGSLEVNAIISYLV